MSATAETVEQVAAQAAERYKYGFVSDVETELAPKGLSEDIIRFISRRKEEPEWMLEWRLKAYRHWLTMREPTWAKVGYPSINYQDLHYYAAPRTLVPPERIDVEVARDGLSARGIPVGAGDD